jgi:hypothetical protein
MFDADELRGFADECLKLADEANSAAERKGLIELALAWSKVAETSERPKGEESRVRPLH